MSLALAFSEVGPLERRTLGEQAYAQLAELLVSGRLAPGDRMSLRRMAEVLGVSMMPVREAVTRLTAEQALEVTPNRAVRVPLMTADRFRDLTRVRIAIEGHAAAEAARRRSDEDLVRIRAAEARFRAISEAASPVRGDAIESNKEFHFAVYAAAASPLLLEIVRGLWLKVGPIINLDLRDNPERLAQGDAARFHAAALAAIEAANPEAAQAAIAGDIAGTAEFLISRGRIPAALPPTE